MFEVSSKCAVSCPPREAQCKLLCFAEQEKGQNIRQGIQRQFYQQCYAALEHIAFLLEAFLLQPSNYLLFLNIEMPFCILNPWSCVKDCCAPQQYLLLTLWQGSGQGQALLPSQTRRRFHPSCSPRREWEKHLAKLLAHITLLRSACLALRWG